VAALSLATGCGGDAETTTVTVTTTEVRTETTTVTVTRAVVATRARTRARARTQPPRGVLRFGGNGDRRLPPIRVRRGGTTLRWRNTGAVFSLLGQRGIIVDSVARSGATYLGPGVYELEIIAAGTWRVTIPRAGRAVD
jgi:hypothetical protein